MYVAQCQVERPTSLRMDEATGLWLTPLPWALHRSICIILHMAVPTQGLDGTMTRPLEGMLVVEFGQLIAGPNAGMILGSYGAEVIKVEPPGGDPGRALQATPVLGNQLTSTAVAYNQGKRSIVLDLKQPDAQDVARRLMERADVVIESSRPGVMDRLGLGAEEACRRNSRLVYASVSAFGATGPDRTRGGVDIVVQAESGIMAVTGEADGPPLKVGFQVVDVSTGHVLAQAILAALLERERGGAGQFLEVALVDVAMHLQASSFTEYLATNKQPPRCGNSAPQTAPSDLFKTADGHMVVTAYLEPHWQAMCAILEMPDLLVDSRFASKLDRVLHRPELFEILQTALLTRATNDWFAAFDTAGIPVGQVKTYADIVGSPQAQARGTIISMVGSDGLPHQAVRLPPRFANWSTDSVTGPPFVGEHTRQVLAELGLEETEIARLTANLAQLDRPT
jgi:crotonobetainyl-CoA:carnitine CoA-transferase CaiB-like acyl-CoA transferase